MLTITLIVGYLSAQQEAPLFIKKNPYCIITFEDTINHRISTLQYSTYVNTFSFPKTTFKCEMKIDSVRYLYIKIDKDRWVEEIKDTSSSYRILTVQDTIVDSDTLFNCIEYGSFFEVINYRGIIIE